MRLVIRALQRKSEATAKVKSYLQQCARRDAWWGLATSPTHADTSRRGKVGDGTTLFP